jgi:hypothetical protein
LIVYGHGYEDHFLVEVLRDMGISGRPMASNMFLGHPFSGEIESFFWERHIRHSQPAIGNVQRGTRIARFSHHQGPSYFFHQIGLVSGDVTTQLALALFHAPPTVIWWMNLFGSRFCMIP